MSILLQGLSLSSGACRVRLEDAEALGGAATPGGGVYLHARVATVGARRQLLLAGRLVLANALRRSLLYKVRARCADAKAWRSVCSGELDPESVGRSVLCGADCEMVLKIKFASQDTGWSGDIPLKECPKENVPWLVKVPSGGETTYVSVWCRVVRARSDGRVLAAVWPLYVLYSHLPLDTDVLVTTETELSAVELPPPAERPPPLVQATPGRGACTHLLAPGTTAARHQLSFQYKLKDIECPVTREAIPLHYGVTDTSVFDKRAPVNNIDEVIEDIRACAFGKTIIAKKNAPQEALQKVRYGAVRAGGGCSLEIRLSPVVLLCNAAPLPLTLRAHDAAPLCKVEPGAAISAPSAVLGKAFFMSVEIGRETFVSSQLQVWGEEPGRYGAPPLGCVALDHAAAFAIQCNHKVALLTLHYEIKEDINVLGVTPTFMLINRLNMDLMVSAIAVPVDSEKEAVLRPKSYKVVKPTKEDSLDGEPLSRFWLSGRWRGGEASELRTYLCLSLPETAATPAPEPAPVPATASAAALASVPAPPPRPHPRVVVVQTAVVVVQQKHEGRWVVTVAPDPCPQFVVHNRTSHVLAIAEPVHHGESQPASTQVLPECAGARWWCAVAAGAVAHYSTPAHCARFPPPPEARPTQPIPFIAIGRATSYEVEPEWSAGVAAAGGEQLVQLAGGVTVKLRAHPHPHSTLLELQDVDQNDISASDIRRRLQGPFFSEQNMFAMAKWLENLTTKLEVSVLQHSDDRSQRGSFRKLPIVASRTLEPATEIALEPAIEPELDAGVDPIPPESGEELAQLLPENNMEETRPSEQIDLPKRSKGNVTTHFLTEWAENNSWSTAERLRCVIGGIAIEMAATPDVKPLFALHIDRAAILLQSDNRGTKTVLSIADIQMDNLQYESGQYDFGVVASTRAAPLARDDWPPLWSAFAARDAFASRQDAARLLLCLRHDRWRVVTETFSEAELTEVELSVGPLALYVEDGYVAALAQLARSLAPAAPARRAASALAEARALVRPLRLRLLHLHPLDLTLTLHTAVRMYIALDQSPLRLSAFQLEDMMTSTERLTHALTVHYLSAAILGAGWVVGGLELLGAPGALAARVGGATGGVRGVAAAAAAALLRSLSAWAGSLARNLDLLAGDEEHARRAAAARRRPPDSFMAGLAAGITNFAINILGAVGGLAHHPLVGVAVGETESGAAALRRGLVGALAKPLSATADLLALAGTGLLRQTGWDPVPQPRAVSGAPEGAGGWRRDCVRWAFRLAELAALAGYDVLLDGAPLRLLLTHKFLVVADPESERIVEMIDLRFCTLGPFQGAIVELIVAQRRQKEKVAEARLVDEDDEYQISAAAMARVARYTGAGGAAPAASEARVLALLPPPRRAPALHAALAAAIHHNADSHLHLL
ncbi:hypothetical protein MSG28_000768 [Choristoneura fumiferana]|uniref:Uncharacterized protein n=1 Tax=Choristoneura fumiferana TaxID=7141 RepID=A0ACC0K2R5_CHOFU|nr:hypothetical protein MSG28_000768 [Choristoneura fumiferana]